MTPRIPACRYGDELTWRYQHAAGECGARAQSYEPTSVSVGLAPEGHSDRTLAACARVRRIEAALDLLRADDVRILAAAYALPDPGVARLDAELLGELAAVVVVLAGRKDVDLLVGAARRYPLARAKVREWVARASASVRHAQGLFARAWAQT